MYAIRSYYVLISIHGRRRGTRRGLPLSQSLLVFIPERKLVPRGVSTGFSIITSYSIHYTKLYDLWTSNGGGSKVSIYKAANESGEARFISDKILDGIKNEYKYNDFAVLYRMNAQSNIIEQSLIASGIPYKIIGGLKFYDRKEIKDIIAYLSVINNPADLLRLKRIINVITSYSIHYTKLYEKAVNDLDKLDQMLEDIDTVMGETHVSHVIKVQIIYGRINEILNEEIRP